MKKRITVFLLICVMALSVAVPAMATDVDAKAPISETSGQVEISPFIEMTRIYWRNHQGQLQMRVWSITNGRWLTDWITM